MSRTYILGAGSSAGYCGSSLGIRPPTALNFFQRTVELIDRGEIEGQRFEKIFDFIKRYYDYDINRLRIEKLDIEEVLTLLDIPGVLPHKYEERQELVEMIYLTLDKILYGQECVYHRKLVDSINSRNNDTIITFNWDLLIDNMFFRNGQEPNYHLSFTSSYFNDSWREPCSVLRNIGPSLLKLHGSLNWMTCNCGSIAFSLNGMRQINHLQQRHHDRQKKYLYILSGKMPAEQVILPNNPTTCCPNCGKQMLPIIILPTLMKKYNQYIYSNLWRKAKAAIRSASEIVIIGYSLPLTDFRAKWLFMSAVDARKGRPFEKVILVDKNPTTILMKKYQQLFKTRGKRFEVIRGGINNFVNIYCN